MISVDNINILKKTYPNFWNRFKQIEDNLNKDLAVTEETRRGDKTLYINKDNKKVYMHSKYDPIREAQAVVEEHTDINEDSTVIFYGTGLGYHIDGLLDKYSKINYYIYEPIPEILHHYLANKQIRDLSNKNLEDILVGSSKEEIVAFLNKIIDKNRGSIKTIEFPIHKQIFKEEYKKFIELFKEIVKEKRSNLHVNYAFQENWITNSMRNFKTVLSTPNILLDKSDVFKDKPVILVAAGPSLNKEIENLRYIKENNLAYIITVGSAINTLLYHNIHPHAVTGYDPKDGIWGVFSKVINNNIVDIPLIFGSSIGYKTTQKYTGQMLHMITSQDSVSNYYLKEINNEKIPFVADSPSIAIITLQLLAQLKAGKIILVGQNLALIGDNDYAEGISYRKDGKSKFVGNKEDYLTVKDVYGNDINTLESYNSMRTQMENYISHISATNVINTTKGGAHIEGTKFIPLEDVIKDYLKKPVVDIDWLSKVSSSYDMDYLTLQKNKMKIQHIRALKFIDEYFDILNKIERLIINRNFNQAEKEYIKLNRTFTKIEKNSFFITFILPMVRLQYKILADSIDSLNAEKSLTEKGNRIINSFKGFMDLCKETIEKVEPIFDKMNEDIDKHLERQENIQ